MATLLLIRHATNDFTGKKLIGRLPGVHLNQKGLLQAQKLAEVLAQTPIKAIYSSPLERTVETAEPLAQRLGLPVITRPGLVEIDFGRWVGKSNKQMRRMKLWKQVQESPSQMRFPEGESFVEAQQRVGTELCAIAAQHEEDDLVAVFSHADAIRLGIAHYLGLGIDYFQRLGLDTASITTLHLPKEGAPFFGMINYVVGREFKPSEPKKPKNSG